VQSYEETLRESQALWRTPGNGLELAIRFVEDRMNVAEGELRGRLSCLLGQFLLLATRKNEAHAAQVEALSLVTEPAARLEVLVSAIYVCIPFRRVAEGMRYAFEAERMLKEHTDADAVKWRAVYLRNTGELLMRVGDYETAIPYLKSAIETFEAMGKHKEALRSKVDLAEAMLYEGNPDLALALCREVRLDVANDYVLFKLNVVQARVAARRGLVDEAERLIDQAYSTLYEKLSDMDRYTAVDLERAKAEVADLKGDETGAKVLRHFARRMASAIGVAFE
jgi:tetratricopeptide (TPR) repeat protein